MTTDLQAPRWTGRPGWRWTVTAAAIAVAMGVPLANDWVARAAGRTGAYVLGTIAMVTALAVASFFWPSGPAGARTRPARGRIWFALTGAALAFALVFTAASSLLPTVFYGPLDLYRGDMLPVIEAGVREFLEGRHPYRSYDIAPWQPTLVYGPGMWLPFVLPVLARTDVRMLTLVAYHFVVAASVVGAAFALAVRARTAAAALAILGAALAWHPEIRAFHQIGHVFIYWPLLVAFCALLRIERWAAAAAALGLLVCARSTYVALVPVFLLAALHERRLTRGPIVALLVSAIGPFLPFVVRDPGSVWYALVGSYDDTIKKYVWSRGSVELTYGLTGRLLERGLHAYVLPAQVVCLLTTYVLAWRAIARGKPLEPWLGLALLVFSLTTLWPVIYLFFDVWVLLTAGLLCTALAHPGLRLRSLLAGGSAIVAIAAAGVLGAAFHEPGASYEVAMGTSAAAPLTGGGFGTDDAASDGSRSFVWVEGTTARVRLPRAAWTGATIAIELRPHEPFGGLTQTVLATLNDQAIGTATLRSGWQHVSFTAPARAWMFGFNVLTLHFSYAVPPSPSVSRSWSVGISRISVQ